MFFTRAVQVALGATLLLALEPGGGPRRIQDLAEELGVGDTYLSKVLQGLVRAGLLKGVRGPGGGVRLARPADEIHQWDVFVAVQSSRRLEECVLEAGQCDKEAVCPLHEAWQPIREQIRLMLQTTNLLELIRKRELEPRWRPRAAGTTPDDPNDPLGEMT